MSQHLPEGFHQWAQTLFAAEPRADILVNNLGIFNDVDVFEAPDSEWTRFYEVNVILPVPRCGSMAVLSTAWRSEFSYLVEYVSWQQRLL